MRNFLGFPEKYAVSVNMDLPIFLQKANLSERGKAYLLKYVTGIELLYIIRLQDKTEIPVYQVCIQNGCLWEPERDSVRLVAESMPYECIIVLQKAKAVRLYFFKRHVNSRNNRRSRIDSVFKTRTMVYGKRTDISERILGQIRNALQCSETSKDFFLQLEAIHDDVWDYGWNMHLEELWNIGKADYDILTGNLYTFPEEEIGVLMEMEDEMDRNRERRQQHGWQDDAQ